MTKIYLDLVYQKNISLPKTKQRIEFLGEIKDILMLLLVLLLIKEKIIIIILVVVILLIQNILIMTQKKQRQPKKITKNLVCN